MHVLQIPESTDFTIAFTSYQEAEGLIKKLEVLTNTEAPATSDEKTRDSQRRAT